MPHGHAAGHDVLRQVAELLTARVRGSDTVARLGGDEFAVILARCEAPVALRIADQIRAGALQVAASFDGERLSICASIGLVEITPEMADVATVLRLADAACYDAKRAGRDAVRSAPRSTELRVIAGGG
jgi:diguanylate cyclase